MSNVALSPVETRPRVEAKEGTYKVAATTLVLGTNARVQMKNITHEIAEVVAQTSIRDGIVQVSSLHTTAGLILNEVQEALLDDVTTMFEQVVPRGVYYKHNDPQLSDCDRKNADSHLRAVVVGHSLSIPVENGRLKLGTWQQVLFTEFDGPNTRRLHVQVMGI
ncbi:MAG: YjbQ family protein [Acidobacteria bacterium]|nr:YjbQ family protein [Acidobacteriota bacterium]MBI3424120.1 YjbQ family protein [Acidobacteriota bacterium]